MVAFILFVAILALLARGITLLSSSLSNLYHTAGYLNKHRGEDVLFGMRSW